MRRTAVVLAMAVALSGSACGDITVFCLSAGAPDGLTLALTNTPSGPQCNQQIIVDSLGRPSQGGGGAASR